MSLPSRFLGCIVLLVVTGCLAATPSPAPTPTATPEPTPTNTPAPTPTVQARGTLVFNESNTVQYAFAAGSLNPLRMALVGESLYFIDAGSLKRVDLDRPTEITIMVTPGDLLSQVPVKELGDLAVAEDGSLLLLDHSGDVYRYHPRDGRNQVERYAIMPYTAFRQYLSSIAADGDTYYLLDINIGQVWRHADGNARMILESDLLKEAIDFAVGDEDLYVLTSPREGSRLVKLVAPDYSISAEFKPPALEKPSYLRLEDHLWVIDQGGQRVLMLDPLSGGILREHLVTDPTASLRAVANRGDLLYLVGRDQLWVYPGLTPNRNTPPREVGGGLRPDDPAMLERLKGLDWPIQGTALSELSFRLPGAPRAYRYGVHEGIDFFWSGQGALSRDTPVLAVAEGTIVRVDWDYVEHTAEEMDAMLARTRQLRYTPPDIFDRLRGRQVWLDLGDGIIVYYAHLSRIDEGLQVGQRVQRGQVLGYVGNSGTPEAQRGEEIGLHLHLEVRIGQWYFGQYLRPSERRAWLQGLFGSQED